MIESYNNSSELPLQMAWPPQSLTDPMSIDMQMHV